MGYDFIGDVHGYADHLTGLLAKLGYSRIGGVWRHRDRKAVFVGDLINRGSGQLEVLEIVSSMVSAGAAHCILGNHEVNAIAYATESIANPGRHLRVRSGSMGSRNHFQHKAFLDEVGLDSSLHRELISWFLTLPLWLELEHPESGAKIRVAHACWHQDAIDRLKGILGSEGRLSREILVEAYDARGDLLDDIEIICKGPEFKIPSGHFIHDAGGIKRTKTRSRWWDPRARNLRTLACVPAKEAVGLPEIPVSGVLGPRFDRSVPIVVGHYWMDGTPAPIAHNVACVDYSVARGGNLVAYRWDGETVLTAQKFVSCGVAADPAALNAEAGALDEAAMAG